MPTLNSSYLVPAILLNPALVLHLFNTFLSHLMPQSPQPAISHSPHPFMERLGPIPASKPYLDFLADDQLCWSYTAIMVIVQLFAFGRVQDNRVRRKSAKAARLEREKLRKEKRGLIEDEKLYKAQQMNGHGLIIGGGRDEKKGGRANEQTGTEANQDGKEDTLDNDASMTETSEDDMIA